MSSNFPPPPQGDQYLYTSRYSFNHDIPGLDGSVLSYHASQPQSLPDDIGESAQNNQSTNTYAFNTNRNATYRDGDESGLHSKVSLLSSLQPQVPLRDPISLSAPQALPGLPNAAAAQTNGLELQTVHGNRAASVVSNGVGTRIEEQIGSDLEEGELSEGTDHASPNILTPNRPASISHSSSMNINRAFVRGMPGNGRKDFPRKALSSERTAQGNAMDHRSPAPGADGTENRHWKHGGTRATRQAVNGRAKMDWAGRDRTPPTQRHRVNTLKASQEAARRAVKQLQPHHIGYLQLLNEHIDPELLRRICTELQIAIPESSNTRVSPANAFPESKSHTKFIQNITDPHTDTPDTKTDPTSQNASRSQDWHGTSLQNGRESDAATERIKQISDSAGENYSGHEKDPSINLEKAIGGSTRMRIDTNSNSGPTAIAAASKLAKPSPAITNDKSTPILELPQRPTQPLAPATAMTSKSQGSKTAPKPVDRKDYIARLLAAKAGKALPTTNAPKPLPDPVPQKVPQILPVGTKDENSKIDKPDSGQGLSNPTLKKIKESSGVVMSSAAQKSAAAEAKKREKTELARRKIEELKKRSEALKSTPPPANEAPTASDPQQSPAVQGPTPASPERIMVQFTRPPPLQNTSQHSYFPLHNATFSIPGLFTLSQPNQLDLQEAPPTAVPIPDQTSPADPPATMTSTDIGSQESIQAMKTPASPGKEHKVSENGPLARTTISRTASNPRKRPTAADFLELVPSKSRRLGVSRPDSSVVFEVSDDESDESDHNIAETKLNGDQDLVSNQAGGLQISRTGSTEQTSLSQHSALTGSLHNSELDKSIATLPLQSSLAPPKLKESGGLRSKEEEIARMNRKIAEMEQRRKFKQKASRAQTPGTPGNTSSSIKLADDNDDVAHNSSGIRRFSEPTGRMEEGKRILEDVQTSESTLLQDSLIKQRRQSVVQSSGTRDSAVIRMEEQQRRKAEIESRIPSMDATVQEFMARLSRLQKEEADLQAQIQREIDDKRVLQSELDNMVQPSASFAESSANSSAEMPESGLAVGSQALVSPVPTPKSPDEEEHPEDIPSNGLHVDLHKRASFDGSESPVQPSAPGTPLSTEAPTDQVLVNGELAEDVMDISGSEDEDAVAEHQLGPVTNGSPAVEKSDGEESYEPPVSFEVFGNDPIIAADYEQPRFQEKESLQQEPWKVEPSTSLTDCSRRSDPQDDVEDDIRPGQLPDASDHASSIVNMSESDDYEPPEPSTSVDVPSLTHDAPAATSESSFSPPDANEVIEIEPASPEPLVPENNQAAIGVAETAANNREKADFVSRVGNGYRSLTYSHNIDALKPLCPFEIGGKCNDPACDNQHFKSMNLSGAFGEQDTPHNLFAHHD
ncbi:MAG: hypothetical protein Q9216_000060 [Gyalolechia sp. 2 TL-2023]